MLHSVVCRLLCEARSVRAHLGADRLESLLLRLMGRLQLFNACELVGHFVLHAIDVLSIDFHFFVHTTLQVRYLFEVLFASFDLNLKGSRSGLSLVKLTLLKVEILTHLLDTVGRRKLVLARQILLHVLKEGSDSLLSVCHFRMELLLLGLVLLSEIINLFFLFIQNLVLLIVVVATVFGFVTEITFNLFDVSGVCVDHLSKVGYFLLLLLDLSVVLLDSVHEALPCLRER